MAAISTVCFLADVSKEIANAARVANWLPKNLQFELLKDIEGDTSQIAVSGHSRGGRTAFAIALNKSKTILQVKISGIVEVDPVSIPKKWLKPNVPCVLTNKSNSLDLPFPALVIVAENGSYCAPNGLNHDEFFNECRSGAHFVVKDCGHMDMLDDDARPAGSIFCTHGSGPKYLVRRTVGGLTVAYLKSYLLGKSEDYDSIIANPLAPAKLAEPQVKRVKEKGEYYSPM